MDTEWIKILLLLIGLLDTKMNETINADSKEY